MERLKAQGQQLLQFILVGDGCLLNTCQDRLLKRRAIRIVLRVETRLCDKAPQPFDQIQVGGICRQKESLTAELLRHGLHQRAPLIARVVQDHRDRDALVGSSQEVQ